MIRKVLFTAITAVLLSGGIHTVFAAQLDAEILTNSNEIKPSYKFLRVIFIDYPQGGEIEELLRQKDQIVSFTADSATPGISNLVKKINESLRSSGSSAIVTDAIINYQATLDSNDDFASIEYSIEVIPTITNILIREQSDGTPALVDTFWRGIKIEGPIMLETPSYGSYDINNPKSLLDAVVPQVSEKLEKTDAVFLIENELLDASEINELPLRKWHWLFDPTAITQEAKMAGFSGDSIISTYSMGTCNIFIEPCKDKLFSQDFVLDKKYTIRSIESQDDATITLEGYVTPTIIGDVEYFGISKESPGGHAPPTEFPVSIIYGMAGAAGIGAIAVLIFSNYKLKKESGMGQTGIDPALLRVQETSHSAGSYKTNRGETQLIEKTNSLYTEDSKDVLPKDWKKPD